jgi:hypothetical protein
MTEYKLPEGVERAVRAMCEDYDRRASEICRAKLSVEVLAHYMLLNAAIDRAISEICEEGIRKEMRRDIGLNRGYHFTQLYFLAEGTYKDRKRKSKHAIAKALHLI